MVKRVSCRVVRSKPLGKSSAALWRASPIGRPWASSRRGAYWFNSNGASTLNNDRHKIGDVFTDIPQGKCACNPITYTRLMEITSVSVDNGLTGQILDFYV